MTVGPYVSGPLVSIAPLLPRFVVPTLAVTVAASLILFATSVSADPVGVCKDSRGCNVGPGNSDDSSSDEAGRRLGLWLRCKVYGGGYCPSQTTQKPTNGAEIANHQGIVAYKQEDWARAIALFQQAMAANPNEPVYRENLAKAQGGLAANANAEARLDAERREKALAGHMRQTIQNVAQSLKATPSVAGLDFDGVTSGSSPNPDNSALAFTSDASSLNVAKAASTKPSAGAVVVDGRNVSSGLPKAWEDAIAAAYRDAPPGVIERVRKGFQAVQVVDWQVARAWFGDALRHDPDNARLKMLIASVESRPQSSKQTAPVAGLQLPSDEDIRLLFPGEQADPDSSSTVQPPGGDQTLAFRGYNKAYCPGATHGTSVLCYQPVWTKKGEK